MSLLKDRFGKRIKELRKSLGLTQEQVAEIIGMETPNISKMENGLHFPLPDNIERLALAFGVKVSELFEFEHFKTSELIISEICEYLKTANRKELELVYKLVQSIRNHS